MADTVPTNPARFRIGLVTAGNSIFWFVGSAAIGVRYDVPRSFTIAFSRFGDGLSD